MQSRKFGGGHSLLKERRGYDMPIYITLWRYTRDGLVDIRNTAGRFEAVKKIIESHGGKLISIYGLIGEYDVMTIMEMPDKSAFTATILKICSSGRIAAESMQALPIEEFIRITKEV
jgi:uncharacterized protein with GYD domain